MKLTSQMIKDKAKEMGIDCIAIGNVERFKDAPELMSPLTYFPKAKSVIALAMRIPRGTYRGIEEDVFAQLLTHVLLEADDTLGILITGVAIVRTYSRELGRDTVELEEEIVVTLILYEVVCSILERLVVAGVRELHATFVIPILTAIVTALSVTTSSRRSWIGNSRHTTG